MIDKKKNSLAKKIFGTVKSFFIAAVGLAAFVFQVAVSATFWLIASLFGGYSAITYGVFLLYGEGYAFICAGVCAMTLAAIIFRGMRRV